jgi:hypothetical protein
MSARKREFHDDDLPDFGDPEADDDWGEGSWFGQEEAEGEEGVEIHPIHYLDQGREHDGDGAEDMGRRDHSLPDTEQAPRG